MFWSYLRLDFIYKNVAFIKYFEVILDFILFTSWIIGNLFL